MLNKMRQINPYAIAVLSVFAATVLTQLLHPLLASVSFTLFYAAIAISAWLGGTRPGLVAMFLSILSISYFFLPPIHSFAIADSGNLLRLIFSIFVAFLINYLISELRNVRYQIEQLSNRRLQESEEQLRLAMQAAHMGVWNWNLVTGKINWSLEHEQMLGLAPGTFDGRYETFDACLHPDDRDGLNHAVQTAIQEHRIYKHEYRIIWTDGSIHWVEGRGQTFYDETGKPFQMTGTLMDIDERKQLELALRQSEQQFRAIFEAEPECVKIVTADGILHNMNPAGLAMLEADHLEQVRGQCVCPLIEPTHQQSFLEFTQDVAQGKTATFEFEITGLKGTRRRLESHAVPLQSLNDEHPLVLAVTRDITERKKAEEALRLSEERYRSLVEATTDSVWLTDAQGNVLKTASLWTNLTGQLLDENSERDYLKTIHPDDRDHMIQVYTHCLATGDPYEIEYRVLSQSGECYWLAAKAVPVHNLDGSIREWIGTFNNITERRTTETILIQSKLELEQRVAERTAELQQTNNLLNNFFNAASSAGIGLCIHDQNLRFVQINEALAAINGHSVAEHLGKTTTELMPELALTVNPLHEQVLTTRQPIVDLEIAAEVPSQAGVMRYWLASYFPIVSSNSGAQTVGVGVIVTEISDRKQVENALRVSQARLAGILDNANDAIISVDGDQHITLFNQGAEKIFGYVADEVMGQPLNLLLPTRFAMIHRLHVEQFKESGNQARRMGERTEVYGRRKDGTEFPAEASISKLDLNEEQTITAFLRDITQRKQSEATSAQLASVVESSDEAIISKTLEGIVVSWNASAERLFGYSAEEMIGHPMTKIVPADRLEEEVRILEHFKRGERIDHHETVRQRKDGTLIEIAITISPIRDVSGKVIGASKIAHDITEQRAVERMKAEFISIVSHELRTPLTSISGALELLSTGLIQPESDRGKETIGIAATEVDRLTRLVNDILDLERLESGKIRLERQPWDLALLLTRAVDFMQLTANQMNITLLIEPLSVILDIDGERILQVLTNLLSNAVKFSPNHTTIWVTAEIYRKHHILITVRDEGRGIPINKLESIFERFQQVDASDSRKKGGTGLGLAICRSIVQQHGGAIWAESVLEKGTCFHFTLPLTTEA